MIVEDGKMDIKFQEMVHEASKVRVLYCDGTEAKLRKKTFKKNASKSNLHNFTPLETNDFNWTSLEITN